MTDQIETLRDAKNRAQNTTSLRRTNLPTSANDEDKPKKPRKKKEEKQEIIDQTETIQESSSSIVNNLQRIEVQENASVQELESANEIVSNISEINANQLAQLHDLNTFAKEISSRLLTFSGMLKEKRTPLNSTTATELMGPPKPNQDDETSVKVIDDESKASNELVKKPKEESGDGENVKGAPNTVAGLVVGAIGKVASITQAGFKKSTSIADKISGMLFKFTVSRAIEAAKTAAMLFGLILAIDVLKILWAKWGGDVMKKLEEWSSMFSEWWNEFKQWTNYFTDFTSLFDSMAGDWTAIREAWESGDWPALAKALGVAFADSITTLIAALQRILSKLAADLLNALGFKDTAKDVEERGLTTYQEMTGNELNDENAKKVADFKQRQTEKGPSFLNGLATAVANPFNFKTLKKGTDEMVAWIKGDKPVQDQSIPREQKVQIIAAENEATQAVRRATTFSSKVDMTKEGNLKKYNSLKDEAQKMIDSDQLKSSPDVKSKLQNQLNNNLKTKITPASSYESKDVQIVNSIKQNEQKDSKPQQSNNTANINTTNIKNNRNISVQAPITSSNPPGIYGANGVN